MKKIAVIHLGAAGDAVIETVTFLTQLIQITRVGCGGDLACAQDLIAKYDGQVEALVWRVCRPS
jgi:hypothetical protein